MKRLTTLLALAVMAAACAGSGDTNSTAATTSTVVTGRVVESADGALVLEVSGPSSGTVAVSATALTALDLGDDVEVVAAYELAPSGTDFATPVAMTFDTGQPFDDTEPIPLYVALIESGDGWEALSPVTISDAGGTVTVSADIPHFSRLVIYRGDLGMWIEPIAIDTVVGAEWDAGFDVYDRRFAHVINEPARVGRVYDDFFGDSFIGRIRELRVQTSFEAAPVATGVVSPVPGHPGNELDTYDARWPSREGPISFRDPMTFVEVIYGQHRFRCDDIGTGTYGFDLDVVVDRNDIVFGSRLASGQVALVRPSDGVRFRYEIHGDARCRDRYGQAARLLTGYYYLPGGVVETAFDRRLIDDGMSDGIYSISTVVPGVFTPAVDLWDVAALQIETRYYRNDWITNRSVFECGETVDMADFAGPVTTVCAPDVVDIPEGPLVVVVAAYSGALPTPGDPSHYTYAAVFESNGDPADDWQFQGGFDWDFFIGTDRWYQIDWDPAAGAWSMRVSNALDPAGPSGARALVIGDTVIWLIPGSEFVAAVPEVRVTSFIHDGSFAPEASGGDVSGADPTTSLIPVEPLE